MKAPARWTTVAALALVFASMTAGPVASASPGSPAVDPTPPPGATGSVLSGEERAAVATALKTGKPTTIDSLTTEYSTTVANPTGGFTFTTSRVPQRVKKNGAWTAIDTTLMTGTDGRIRPSAALSDVSFSSGGNVPLTVTSNQGASVTVSLASPLPVPTISGDTVTYGEVLAGVDLQLTATATGYTQVWVVKDAKAASNPALKALTTSIEVTGATATTNPDGSVAIGSAENPVLSAGAPTAWDSTPSAADKTTRATAKSPGDGQRAVTPSVRTKGTSKKNGATATSYTQTLTVPEAMLTSPLTQFPLFIDPGWDMGRAHFKVVTDLGYTYADNADVLRVGYCQYTGCYNFGNTQYYVARSYVSFDLSVLNRLHGGQRPTVTSANVNTHQVYNAAGSATTLYLTAATGLPSGWPGSAGSTLATATIAGDTYTNLGGSLVASNLQATMNAGGMTAYFGYTSDETRAAGNTGWKKLANDPVLQVTYTYSPNIPTNFSVVAAGCGGTSVVSSHYPTFKLNASDDGNLLQKVTIQILSGSTVISTASPTDTANGEFIYQWPTSIADGTYTAKASATNLDVTSAWTSPITFTVSTQAPAQAPTVSQPSTTGQSVIVTSPLNVPVAGFGFAWDSSTVATGADLCTSDYSSPLSGYLVANRYVTADTLAGTSTAVGWAAEIPAPPGASGVHTVYVKSFTAAGNTQGTPVSMQVNLSSSGTIATEFQAEALTPVLAGGLTPSAYTTATSGMNGSAVAYSPANSTSCPTLTSQADLPSAPCYVEYSLTVPSGAYNPALWQIQVRGVVTSTSARAMFSFPGATFSSSQINLARLQNADALNCPSPCSRVQTVTLAAKTVGISGSPGLQPGAVLKVRVYPMTSDPVVIDALKLVGTAVSTTSPGSFVPNSTVRLIDTRTAGTPVAANSAIAIPVVNTPTDSGAVPAGASAAVVNLTVTQPTSFGWLAASSTTATRNGSNLNFVAGQTVANLAVVPLGPDGSISLFNGSQGTSHVVVDLVGYYVGGTPTVNGAYQPLSSTYRVNSANPVFTVPANGSLTVNPSALSGGLIPLNATSLMISVAFIPGAAGVGSVQAAGAINYGVSNQNYVSPGNAVAALVSTATTNGNIALVNQSSQATGMVLDVLGYTISGTSNASQVGMFVPSARMRAFDTRNTSTGLQAPLASGRSIILRASATNGAAVAALVTTVTVTNATSDGYVTAYPASLAPSVGSTLNFVTGTTIANLNVSKASPQGAVSYTATTPGTVDLIVDIAGYYTTGG